MYAALLLVSRRFPRTRGDRPCMAFRAEPRPRVPPHARG